MSDAVEILASGPQAAEGQSDWFDASAYSTLRLNLLASADMGARLGADLHFYLETTEGAGRPVVTLWRERYGTALGQTWRNRTRIALAGFDNLVRLRWEGHAEGLTLALAGEALPAT